MKFPKFSANFSWNFNDRYFFCCSWKRKTFFFLFRAKKISRVTCFLKFVNGSIEFSYSCMSTFEDESNFLVFWKNPKEKRNWNKKQNSSSDRISFHEFQFGTKFYVVRSNFVRFVLKEINLLLQQNVFLEEKPRKSFDFHFFFFRNETKHFLVRRFSNEIVRVDWWRSRLTFHRSSVESAFHWFGSTIDSEYLWWFPFHCWRGDRCFDPKEKTDDTFILLLVKSMRLCFILVRCSIAQVTRRFSLSVKEIIMHFFSAMTVLAERRIFSTSKGRIETVRPSYCFHQIRKIASQKNESLFLLFSSTSRTNNSWYLEATIIFQSLIFSIDSRHFQSFLRTKSVLDFSSDLRFSTNDRSEFSDVQQIFFESNVQVFQIFVRIFWIG